MFGSRFSPTIWASRAYAQLIESHVCSSRVVSGLLTPFVILNGSSGLPGFGSVHGRVPSMRSVPSTPASRAAVRTNILMLEPVWRRRRARFTSLRPGANPGPPTRARTAPVAVSSETIADWMPVLFAGSLSCAAFSAFAWSVASMVVVMVRPPLYRAA